MVESSPALMQLRLVQALGGASGNTVVLGMPSYTVPVPISTDKSKKELRGYGPDDSPPPPERGQ